jgi:hypothetical protein
VVRHALVQARTPGWRPSEQARGLVRGLVSGTTCVSSGLPFSPARQHTHTSAYVSVRQHTSAYVSIRQHTSAYACGAWLAFLACSPGRRSMSYVSIRQHTSAYVSIRMLTFLACSPGRRSMSSSLAFCRVCLNNQCLTYADVSIRMLTYADVCVLSSEHTSAYVYLQSCLNNQQSVTINRLSL